MIQELAQFALSKLGIACETETFKLCRYCQLFLIAKKLEWNHNGAFILFSKGFEIFHRSDGTLTGEGEVNGFIYFSLKNTMKFLRWS